MTNKKWWCVLFAVYMAVLPVVPAFAVSGTSDEEQQTISWEQAQRLQYAAQDDDVFTIVLDPGHGGDDPGMTRLWNGMTVREKDMNQAIAEACRNELEKQYPNVKVYLTHTQDMTGKMSLVERVEYAASVQADVIISLHNNASGDDSGRARGAEVLIPIGTYRPALAEEMKNTGNQILEQLQSDIGITNRGLVQRRGSQRYPDGSTADYYGLIRNAVLVGIPCAIVEHAYVDNDADYAEFLSTPEKLEALGKADAKAIAAAYSLDRAHTAAENGDAPFTDIWDSTWYYQIVIDAYRNGIMQGVSETEFAPQLAMTRAMAVQTLYQLAGKPAVTGTCSFDDVTADAWYADAVQWASETGIVSGMSEGIFAPDVNVTREQFAMMLYRNAGSPAVENALTTFPDAQTVSDWAQDAMSWAVRGGIITGEQTDTGIYLSPQGTTTRAQAAAMLLQLVS